MKERTASLITVLVIFTTLSNAASISESNESKPIIPDSKYMRVCYYTNWSQYRKPPGRFLPFNIDPFLCTHLIFSFSKIDYNGHLAPYEWNDIQYPHMYRQFNALKKKNPKLRTLLAVGGWTHGSKPFTEMVSTEEGRHSFIDHAVHYLRTHNFDGLDLDWEYPANRGSPKADKHKFSVLCQELERAFKHESEMTGNERLLLTAAVGGGKKIVLSAYEVPEISRHLDFINLMSYDLFGGWSKTLGTNAGLYPPQNVDDETHPSDSVDGVVQLWLDLGADPSKLIMGIPLYGRSFTICSGDKINVGDKNCGVGKPGPYTREKGFLAYYEILSKLKSGYTRKWLDDQKVPVAFSVQEKQWIGYDDEESVKLKAEYIKKYNLAGAMMWAVDLDDFGALEGDVYPLSRRIRSTLEGDTEFPEFIPPPKPKSKKKPKQRQRPRIVEKKPNKKLTEKPKQTKPYRQEDKTKDKDVSSATFKGPSRVPIITHPSILVHTVHDKQPVLRTTDATTVLVKSTKTNTTPTITTTPIPKITIDDNRIKNNTPTTHKKEIKMKENQRLVTSNTTSTKQTHVQKTIGSALTPTPIETSYKRKPDPLSRIQNSMNRDLTKVKTTAKPRITLEPASISLWDTRKTTISFRSSNKGKTTDISKETQNKTSTTSKMYFGARTDTSTIPTTKTTTAYPWPKPDKTLAPMRSSTQPTTASFTTTVRVNTSSVTLDKELLAYIESSRSHSTDYTSSTITTPTPGKTKPYKKIFKKYRKKFIFPTRKPRIPKSEVKFPFIHTNNIIWTLKRHHQASTSPGPKPSSINPTSQGIGSPMAKSTPSISRITTPRPRTTGGQIKITQSAITKSDKHKSTQNPNIPLTTRKIVPRPYEVSVYDLEMTTTSSDTFSTTETPETTSAKVLHSKYDKTLKQSPFSRKEYQNRQEAERKRLGNAKNNINIENKPTKKFRDIASEHWKDDDIQKINGTTTAAPSPTIRNTTTRNIMNLKANVTIRTTETMIKPIQPETTRRPISGIFTDLQHKLKNNKKKWSTRKTHIFKTSTPVYTEVVLKKNIENRTNYITLRRNKVTTKKMKKISNKPSTTESTTKLYNKNLRLTPTNWPLKSTSNILSSSPESSQATLNLKGTTEVTISRDILKRIENSTSSLTYHSNATEVPVSISNTTSPFFSNGTLKHNYTDWYLLESFARTQASASPTTPELKLRELPELEPKGVIPGFKNRVHDQNSDFNPFYNPLNKFAYTEIRHPIHHDPRFGLLKIPRENKVSRTHPAQGIYGLMTMIPKSTTPSSTKKIDEGDIIIKKGREKLYQYIYHTTESPFTMPWDTPDTVFKKNYPKKLRNIFARPSKFSKEKRKPKGKWGMIKTIATSQSFNRPTQIPEVPVVPIRRTMPLDQALYSLDEEYKYNNINDLQYRADIKYEVDTPQVIIRRPSDKEVFLDDFHCPNVFGIFADHHNCQRFYQCVWFVSFHHTCGQGTVWNDNLKICDWPNANSCIS